MTQANFADNLYAGTRIEGGAGLFGFCGSWWYERHGSSCKPGRWCVGVLAHEAREFYPLALMKAHAVVDDFGTLRMVGEPS